MPSLDLWQTYDRRAVHDIFEPGTAFSPRGGKWGESGMIRLAGGQDFVFFVTFGSSQGAHKFVESISDDGVLTWQSQPSKRLSSPIITQLIEHDPLLNNIYLFLRTKKGDPYTYLGRLGYLAHDPKRERPAYFSWQLLNWPAPSDVLDGLGITLVPSSEPVAPVDPANDTLTETPPPQGSAGGKGGGGRARATLPGQDARNRELGLAGEELVLLSEKGRLIAAGQQDLADKIVHVAVVEGDSAGYDIRSFDADGSTRHIEVKTTAGPASNAFFISPNEIDFSEKHPDTYVLIRVHGYKKATNSANYYEKHGPIGTQFALTASEFRAKLIPPGTPDAV